MRVFSMPHAIIVRSNTGDEKSTEKQRLKKKMRRLKSNNTIQKLKKTKKNKKKQT